MTKPGNITARDVPTPTALEDGLRLTSRHTSLV